MAEWFVEEGIGETRAVRLECDEIAEARLDWHEPLGAGAVVEARLVSRRRGSARGIAEAGEGRQILVDRLPPGATGGSPIRVIIQRPAMAESGRGKLARGRPSEAPTGPAPLLAERLGTEGHTVRRVRRFPAGDWNALLADAFAGEIAFPGGTLLLSPTPAMTLIDIDGEDQPARLALAACEPVARTLRRLDIGGSIGIDFPTLSEKADRRARPPTAAARSRRRRYPPPARHPRRAGRDCP